MQCAVALGTRLVTVHGRWQREDDVANLIAKRFENLSPMRGRLRTEKPGFSLKGSQDIVGTRPKLPARRSREGPAGSPS
jgi:hypothetical protein